MTGCPRVIITFSLTFTILIPGMYERLKSSDGLEETYVKMMQENHSADTSLLKQWEGLLQRVQTKSPTGMLVNNKYSSNNL
jgi:hypothetical protein